ncbi:glycosyltransferase [Bacillus salipaludis]|uniref:Glycosyltransferase n=1 Tax=Bacillus salipaludis TaxID=2547811 RepID=A0ABW8RP88_9BACI
MRKHKISVAMCTYNADKYLDEQISSILSQTMLPDEIVIVDDCSYDNTNNIIEKYKARNIAEIRHIVNDFNIGYIKNFEKAISCCAGDIIFFSDHDDSWESTKIEKVFNYFQSNCDISMIFSDGKLMDGSSMVVSGTLWERFGFIHRNQKHFNKNPLSYLLKRDTVTGATVAIRKKLINDVIPFPEEYVHDAWCALIAASKSELSTIPECLINYRVHSEQQIGLNKNKKSIRRNLEQDRILSVEKMVLLKNRASIVGCCEKSLEQINEKLGFYNERKDYSKSKVQRIIPILRNYKMYFKYASGILSILKDILRSGD